MIACGFQTSVRMEPKCRLTVLNQELLMKVPRDGPEVSTINLCLIEGLVCRNLVHVNIGL